MHFVYSKKVGGLDYKVWLPSVALVIFSIGIFGYKAATSSRCPNYAIIDKTTIQKDGNVSNHTYYVNEKIEFTTTEIKPSKNGAALTYVWNFDDSTALKTGKRVIHTFYRTGTFKITLTLNKKCKEYLTVLVLEQPQSASSDEVVILSPDIILQGEPLQVTTTAVAEGYDWSIYEKPDIPKSLTKDATFYVQTPGIYTLILKLSTGKEVQKKVEVRAIQSLPNEGEVKFEEPVPDVNNIIIPKKYKQEPNIANSDPADEMRPQAAEPNEESKPAAKQYQQLPDPAIAKMFEQVARKEKTLEDFNDIVCDGGKTKVRSNGEVTKLSILIEDLQDKRNVLTFKLKRKIKYFKTTRDPKNGNCISLIEIEYK